MRTGPKRAFSGKRVRGLARPPYQEKSMLSPVDLKLQQQLQNYLRIHAMAKIIGVIDSIRGEIEKLLGLQHALPDRKFIGHRHSWSHQVEKRITILLTQNSFRLRPVRVRRHR